MADHSLNRCTLARVVARYLAVLCVLLAAVPLIGCEDVPPPQGYERVVIKDQTYLLQLATDDKTRTKGLGERASLPENGGMLFVFKRAERRQFLMRDCLIDIDIIYLDANGRITAFHTMPKEPPRGADEGEVGDWDPRKPANRRYESRLKRYSSLGAAQYVIELAGGELKDLHLKVGEKIELDTDRLKALAR